MKKKIFLDNHAERELRQLASAVQDEFEAHFRTLRTEGRLAFPDSKKITKKLFEIRINMQGAFRGFYAYIDPDGIIILHIFRKKTQKTPLQNLITAQRRLRQYE